MAAKRRVLGDSAFRAAVRVAVYAGDSPEFVHEDVSPGADASAADTGLRHRALPPDGRRYPLPARIRLYAGDAVRARRFLRHRFLASQPGATELQRSGAGRPGGDHAARGVLVPAGADLDSGTAGSLFLSRPLRLPADPGGICTGTELGDQPRRHAFRGRREAAPHAVYPSPGLLPLR